VSCFAFARRFDEPENRRCRDFVLASSGWVPVTQPSVTPFRGDFQTVAVGSLTGGHTPKRYTQLQAVLALLCQFLRHRLSGMKQAAM
jgi:hypothetical protein